MPPIQVRLTPAQVAVDAIQARTDLRTVAHASSYAHDPISVYSTALQQQRMRLLPVHMMTMHWESRDLHHFVLDGKQINEVFREDVFSEVVDTPAFRRLKSINFLGAIDYLLPVGAKRPFQRHTRYQHSLAVGSLALHYCEMRGLHGVDRDYCVVSALLHDIGHAPLSHSLEPAFKSIFEIDHHISGERILRGEEPIGAGLARVLANHGLNNIRIMSIIAGVDEKVFNDLFRHSINVDTIEAILRSSTYLFSADHLSPPLLVQALIRRDKRAQEMLDAFWEIKNQVYESVIQSRRGFMADYICKRYMEVNRNCFKPSYYYGTESQLRRDHERLFELLEKYRDTGSIPNELLPEGGEATLIRRKFYINPDERLSDSGSIDRRYRQEKRRIPLSVKIRGDGDEHGALAKYSKSFDLF